MRNLPSYCPTLMLWWTQWPVPEGAVAVMIASGIIKWRKSRGRITTGEDSTLVAGEQTNAKDHHEAQKDDRKSRKNKTSAKDGQELPKRNRGGWEEPSVGSWGGDKQDQKMVKSYQKETEEGRRSRVLGHGGKQTRPTFKIFSLGEAEGVRQQQQQQQPPSPPPKNRKSPESNGHCPLCSPNTTLSHLQNSLNPYIPLFCLLFFTYTFFVLFVKTNHFCLSSRHFTLKPSLTYLCL